MRLKLFLIQFYRSIQKILCRLRFYFLVKSRATKSIYQIHELAKDIPLTIAYNLKFERNNSNLFYSHARILKKFAGVDQRYKLPYAIEHGTFLNNHVWEVDIHSDTPGIITFSDYRKQVLSGATEKPVVTIGPYIHYAESFLKPEELTLEKSKLGKTFLVFPSHSTHYLNVSFDYQRDIDYILELGKEYNTIMICLYWKDILAGKAEYYKNEKFKLVTAGHIFDPLFLPRLKSIIQLSDFTMSNSTGTQIGYCIFLGKPHFVYIIDIAIETSGGVKRHWENPNHEYKGNSRKLVIDSFSKFQDSIDSEQKKVVEYIWGTNHIKTKEEMFDILNGKGMNG